MECGRVREASEALQNFDRGMKPDKGERGRACEVVIEIPKEVLYDTKQTIEQATDFAKEQLHWDFISNMGYLWNCVLRLLE